MKIGKLLFGADDFLYGLELCLSKAGYTATDATAGTALGFDVILVSMFWYLDIYLFERFLRKSGLKDKKEKPVIIIGGLQATVTPELCSKMADYVFIGDADDYLGQILKQVEKGLKPEHRHLFNRAMDKVPEPAECIPSAFYIKKRNDPRATTRIEIARGCKYKCKFCLLSNLKSYREVPADEIIDLLKRINRKGPFSLFAPERTLHSEWERIQKAIYDLKIRDHGSDARLENICKVHGNKVTFGLEGISYKLRKSIKKPFTDDFILNQLEKFLSGCKSIAMILIFFIADLPGENESDWDELWGLFEKIEKENWSRYLTLIPVLNPLSPKPYTAFENVEIHPFRNYPDRWLGFLRKKGSHWGFRVLETMVWGSWRRTLDAIVHRGGESAYEVISRMPNKFLSQIPPLKDRDKLSMQLIKECGYYDITEEMLFYPEITDSMETENARD